MTLDYLAGLLDGEGHFAMAKGDARYSADWRHVRIRITMTTPEPLRAAQAAFGGRFYGPYQYSQYGKAKKPQYIWVLSKRAEILAILPDLVPKLIVKRAEAEAMLAYCAEHPVQERRAA